MQQADGIYPQFIMESFTEPSASMAEVELARDWVAVATTRDGRVSVYRRDDRTLYLDRGHPEPRLELSVPGSCGALSAAFPIQGSDDWVQFGVSPAGALERVGHPLRDFQLDPCPSAGYWVASADRDLVVFRAAPTSGRLELSTRPLSSSGEFVTEEILGLVPMRLQHTPTGARLSWATDHSYAYAVGAPDRALVKTGCRAQRPDWYCWIVLR